MVLCFRVFTATVRTISPFNGVVGNIQLIFSQGLWRFPHVALVSLWISMHWRSGQMPWQVVSKVFINSVVATHRIPCVRDLFIRFINSGLFRLSMRQKPFGRTKRFIANTIDQRRGQSSCSGDTWYIPNAAARDFRIKLKILGSRSQELLNHLIKQNTFTALCESLALDCLCSWKLFDKLLQWSGDLSRCFRNYPRTRISFSRMSPAL